MRANSGSQFQILNSQMCCTSSVFTLCFPIFLLRCRLLALGIILNPLIRYVRLNRFCVMIIIIIIIPQQLHPYSCFLTWWRKSNIIDDNQPHWRCYQPRMMRRLLRKMNLTRPLVRKSAPCFSVATFTKNILRLFSSSIFTYSQK